MIRGEYDSGSRRIRFVTARGPRISLVEAGDGVGEFEVDACFINDAGTPLVSVAGGHEMTIAECVRTDEESFDAAGEQAASAAMEAILRLPFADEFRPEQQALTMMLGFARRSPPRSAASASGHDGMVVVQDPDRAIGR